jgi:hypothetical protein
MRTSFFNPSEGAGVGRLALRTVIEPLRYGLAGRGVASYHHHGRPRGRRSTRVHNEDRMLAREDCLSAGELDTEYASQSEAVHHNLITISQNLQNHSHHAMRHCMRY